MRPGCSWTQPAASCFVTRFGFISVTCEHESDKNLQAAGAHTHTASSIAHEKVHVINRQTAFLSCGKERIAGWRGSIFLDLSPASRFLRDCSQEWGPQCSLSPGPKGKEGQNTDPSMCNLGPFPSLGRGKKSLFLAKPTLQVAGNGTRMDLAAPCAEQPDAEPGQCSHPQLCTTPCNITGDSTECFQKMGPISKR